MKILITGGTGHVGIVLAQRLVEEGHSVRTLAFDESPSLQKLLALGIQHYHVSITDPANLREPFSDVELVFHLAARVSFQDHDWAAVKPVNVDGVQNVVNACKASGVKRLIHFSSLDVFAARPDGDVIDERSPLVADDYFLPYPRSKVIGQRIVLKAIQEGLDAIIIYPAGIIGPYDYVVRATNKALLLFARGEAKVLLKAGLSVVDVRDVVEVAVNAAYKASPGASYLAGGTWATLRDFATCLQPLSGHPVPALEMSPAILRVIAPFASRLSHILGKDSLITVASIHELIASRRVSHERAARDFGYTPRPLEQSIRDTYHWFAENGLLDRRGKSG